jgi:hypothetical protein
MVVNVSLQIYQLCSMFVGDLEQAEDRVHRIGQACTVVCDYLLLADSIEERIWEMLKRKLQDTGTMLNGKKGTLAVCDFFYASSCGNSCSPSYSVALHAAADNSVLWMSPEHEASFFRFEKL